MTRQQEQDFDSIPDELLRIIANPLEIEELNSLWRVNKKLYQVSLEEMKKKVFNLKDLEPNANLAELNAFIVKIARTNREANLKLSLPRWINNEHLLTIIQGAVEHIEYLDFAGCEQLEVDDIQAVVLRCTNLRSLDIVECPQLTNLVFSEEIQNLTSLNIDSCDQLTSLRLPEEMQSLTSINLSLCHQLIDVVLPQEMQHLTSLDLAFCNQLRMDDIQEIILRCPNLLSLDLAKLSQLTRLVLPETMTNLTYLNLSGLNELASLTLPAQMINLRSLDLSLCVQLAAHNIEDIISRCPNLTSLNLNSYRQSNLGDIENILLQCPNLTSLNLNSYYELRTLRLPAEIKNIQYLNLGRCNRLTSLILPDEIKDLNYLNLNHCNQLTTLALPSGAKSLTSLNLVACYRLVNLTLPIEMTNLKSLDLRLCSQLTENGTQDIISGCPNLERLDLSGCNQLKRLTIPPQIKNLTSLNLSSCAKLKSLTISAEITDLAALDLSGCVKLKTLNLTGGSKICGIVVNQENLQTLKIAIFGAEIAAQKEIKIIRPKLTFAEVKEIITSTPQDEVPRIFYKDLSGIDFGQGFDFQRTNLAGSDLTRTNLAGANLAGADLTRVNLSRANLTDANLESVTLTNAIIKPKTTILRDAKVNQEAVGSYFQGVKLTNHKKITRHPLFKLLYPQDDAWQKTSPPTSTSPTSASRFGDVAGAEQIEQTIQELVIARFKVDGEKFYSFVAIQEAEGADKIYSRAR